MRASAVLFAGLLLTGCSHKAQYASAQTRFHDALGTIANYAPLLDATSYGAADKHKVVPAAQHEGIMHICTIAKEKSFVADELNDVEKRVQAALAIAEKGCCDNATTSEIATPTSCNDAVRRESAAIATIEAEAVNAGLPAGSILPAAPPFDPIADRGVSDAIHKAATPTVEEAKLATMWADPAVTPDALKAQCAAAMASDPKPQTADPAVWGFVAYERAADTWYHDNNLSQYTAAVKIDSLLDPGPDAKLCAITAQTFELPPPACLKDTYAGIAKKRCVQ